MSLLNIGLLDAINAKMQWGDENMKVYAGNIANADTPGAKARVLKPVSYAQYLNGMDVGGNGVGEKLQMNATNSMHFPIAMRPGAIPGTYASVQQKTGYDVTLSENNIDIEEQMIGAQKNASEYALATNMYRKAFSMMKLALGATR